MTHMVIFRSAEGRPGYHQADDLDAAIRFVERLRNQESVTDARIFHMQEVPIEFRAYWKVEVSTAAGEGSHEPSPASPEPSALEEPEPGADALDAQLIQPVPVTSGRFGLFSRS